MNISVKSVPNKDLFKRIRSNKDGHIEAGILKDVGAAKHPGNAEVDRDDMSIAAVGKFNADPWRQAKLWGVNEDENGETQPFDVHPRPWLKKGAQLGLKREGANLKQAARLLGSNKIYSLKEVGDSLVSGMQEAMRSFDGDEQRRDYIEIYKEGMEEERLHRTGILRHSVHYNIKRK